ncbi:Ubiquitin- modifier 1 [Coemansia aciculifera]|uniref:Ubiquitin-related modifier 1 n=1 Tax=Coemansia aciculifera TaxID=417176 RepID=A0A9W8IV00_9FUNG|nr:Ubiquitin- modifier 1 [Coemansia aciculifera]
MSSLEKGEEIPQSKDTLTNGSLSMAERKYHSVVTKPLAKRKGSAVAKDAASSETVDSSSKDSGVTESLDKESVDKKSYLRIRTKYTSGMELLIRDKETALDHVFEINVKTEPMNMKDLIKYVGETLVLDGKQSAFSREESICPGIMVIINECDWEVMDDLEYVLQDGDVVEFISTLHGG